MISPSWPSRVWQKTDRCRIILLCLVLADICWMVPIQRQFSMGRYQHYALVLAIFGGGYLGQAAVSWKRLSFWLRISILLTGLFMETTAWVLWNNPWLDWSVAVQTEEREQLRAQLVVDYIVGSVAVALCWIKWWLEGVRAKHRALAKESRGAQK